MNIVGIFFAIGAGLAFVAIGILVLWGSWLALRNEVLPSFVSSPPRTPGGRELTILGLVVPLIGAAFLSLQAGVGFVMMALGL